MVKTTVNKSNINANVLIFFSGAVAVSLQIQLDGFTHLY